MGQEEKGISNAQKYMLIIFMIISGAANTIVYNAQNSTVIEYNGEYYKYQHPYMQALTMFIGEFSSILAFLWTKKGTEARRREYEQEKIYQAALGKNISPIKYLLIVIPASCDFFTSTLQYIALNFIDPSVYQMLRGGVILVTALFSRIILNRKIYNFQYYGCGLVFTGIALVGASNFIFPESTSDGGSNSTAQAVAMILIIISLFFNGGLFVSEEKLLGKFFLIPYQIVGTEGAWGCLIYSIVLPILSYVSCPLATLKQGCVVYPAVDTDIYGKNGKAFYQNQYNIDHSTFESPAMFFMQLGQSAGLTFLVILGVGTIAVYNVSGVNVTKYISSLTRSIVDVSRTVLVWIVSIIFTVTLGKNNPNYQWQNTEVGAIILQILGFIILIGGNFVYNGIIKLPFALPPKDPIEENDETEALIDDQEKDISLQEPQGMYAKSKKDSYRKSTARDSFHT